MDAKTVLWIAAGCLAAGCATHKELAHPRADLARSGLVDDPAQARRLEKALTDGEIAGLLDLDVRAKLPTTLAVAKLVGGNNPRLDRPDAEELTAWKQAIAGAEGITGVQPVSNLAFGDYLGHPRLTLRALRVAAAKLHCELLLVYLQDDSRVDNYNDAAILYWTFAGLWLVPGNTVEHRTVVQAVVVDCRTGAILGTATGDCHRKALAPLVLRDVRQAQLAREAPQAALADLRKGCEPLLSGIAARAARQAALR